MRRYEKIKLNKTCSLCENWLPNFNECGLDDDSCRSNQLKMNIIAKFNSPAGNKFKLNKHLFEE